MPSEMTQLDVWNLVLDHLFEKPLASLNDANAFQRWLKRNHDHVRDLFLRTYPWNFAVQYNELLADDEAPAFRWGYRYKLPPDHLRALPPTLNGIRGAKPLPFEIVGAYLYCDQPGMLQLRTIQRTPDFEEWDNLAIDAFALFLAVRMTYRFTGLATHRDRLSQELSSVAARASEMDTLEGTPEPVEQHTVLDVRDA